MKKLFKILFVFILTIIVWIFFIEPNILTVKHYKIKNEKLKGTKIVFASDFHVKNNEHKKLKKIIKKINKQKPDIVLLGGDFVNSQYYKKTLPPPIIAKEISNIKAKYGIYSVTGNHDFWLDGNTIEQDLQQNGVVVLSNRNKCTTISNKQKVCIAGVEDLSTGDPDINKALKNAKNPIILLSHSPDIFPNVPNYVDLTLSGHTHGGQIVIPFYGPLFVPSMFGNKYLSGLVKENNKNLIVTKGIGTSILPIRFFSLPEIVVIKFY